MNSEGRQAAGVGLRGAGAAAGGRVRPAALGERRAGTPARPAGSRRDDEGGDHSRNPTHEQGNSAGPCPTSGHGGQQQGPACLPSGWAAMAPLTQPK